VDQKQPMIAGRYRIESLEGVPFAAGKAFDMRFGRQVFIKIANASADVALAEAQAASWRAFAAHAIPGMPTILDLGEHEGRPYAVFEWLDGITLANLLAEFQRTGGNPSSAIDTIASQALETLEVLRQHGLVHGDISPHNIMVSPLATRAWLIDTAPELADGPVLATVRWLAPEVEEGRPRTHISDLYALGEVLRVFCEMLGVGVPAVIGRLASTAPEDRPASAASAAISLRRTDGVQRELAPLNWAASPAHQNAGSDFTASTVVRPLAPVPGTAQREAEAESEQRFMAGNRKPRVHIGPGRLSDVDGTAAPPSNPAWSRRSAILNVPIVTKGSDPREADFIVMGPTVISNQHSFPLELWMGPSELSDLIKERAHRSPLLTSRGERAQVAMPSDTIITAVVSLPGFSIANPAEQLVWDGSIRNTAFVVEVPDNARPGNYTGLIKLMVGAVPLGTISIEVTLGDGQTDLPPTTASVGALLKRYRTAFASYSRANSAEVFKRLQAIRASGIDVFIDIADLRGGERWEDTLMREIDSRDIFYLFWSSEAARSPWVEREWRHALDNRGLDFICPLPLQDPREASPPKELEGLHFNDWCLAIIRAEEAIGRSERPSAD